MNTIQLVKFRIPSLHGIITVAGTIQRILDDGKLEVKSQNHGYFIVHPKEILCDKTTVIHP